MYEILGGIIVLTLLILLSGIKIVKAHNRLVIFRFGKIKDSKGPGVQLIIPLIDRSRTIDTRTMTLSIPPLEVITQDNCHVKVSAVCMSHIVDATKAVAATTEPEQATVESAQAVLLSVINRHSIKELVHDRHNITRALKADLQRRSGLCTTRLAARLPPT